MYELINRYRDQIVDAVSENHVSDYEWLMQNKHNIGYQFKQKFRSFWRLNAARLSDEFCDEYFLELQNGIERESVDLREVTKKFYEIPSNTTGTKKLQFSFCTKLCHVIDPCLPIYDSMIRDFYFFVEPKRNSSLIIRIETFLFFYEFLIKEYRRIISEKLLGKAISSFYQKFPTHIFTTEKVIDSLIWSFVKLLKDGGLMSEIVIYR